MASSLGFGGIGSLSALEQYKAKCEEYTKQCIQEKKEQTKTYLDHLCTPLIYNNGSEKIVQNFCEHIDLVVNHPNCDIALKYIMRYGNESQKTSFFKEEKVADKLTFGMIESLISSDSSALKYIPDNIEDYNRIVLKIVKIRPSALIDAPDSQKDREKVFKRAVRHDPTGEVYRCGSDRLKQNLSFFIKAIKASDGKAYPYGNENLKKEQAAITCYQETTHAKNSIQAEQNVAQDLLMAKKLGLTKDQIKPFLNMRAAIRIAEKEQREKEQAIPAGRGIAPA